MIRTTTSAVAAAAATALLALTACTAHTAGLHTRTATPAATADPYFATERQQARFVLTQHHSRYFVEGGDDALDNLAGSIDDGVKPGTRLLIEAACVGKGAVTFTAVSGRHQTVRGRVPCAAEAAAHTTPLTTAGQGLTLTFDTAEGSRGGFAYVVRTAS